MSSYSPTPGSTLDTIPPGPPTGRRRNRVLIVLMSAIAVLAVISLIFVGPLLLRNTGAQGLLWGAIASLLPLSIVLTAVYFMDRWEPEPLWLLGFALLWGATVSVATTTVIQPWFLTLAHLDPRGDPLRFLAEVEAPVVEEFAKSLGLLVIALVARRYFDGPVDGVVFGFTIAAGFAFTENILYFGREFAASEHAGTSFWALVIVRGLMSPFAHAMFTGMTGLIMGFAARRWNRGLTVAAFFVGLIPAMILHNRWNSMGEDFLWIYFVLQIPLFAGSVVGFVFLRRAEARLTRRRLAEYAQAGWLTWQEVQLYGTGPGRRAARRWARTARRRAQMREMIHASTQLAFTREHLRTGRDTVKLQEQEWEYLTRITHLRQLMMTP